jgi:hypothetical protein
MMNLKEGLALATGLILMASAAFAESGAGSFSDLSPGNQKIARALFEAQQPTPNGPHPLSLNQIAARKGDEGWGRVFEQMKSEGLVHDKNLGQVVSSYEHHLHDGHTTSSSGRTIVTTGNGRSFASGSEHGNGGTGKDSDLGASSADHGSGSAGHGHDADTVTVSTAGGTTNASGASASSGGGGSHGGGVGHTR